MESAGGPAHVAAPRHTSTLLPAGGSCERCCRSAGVWCPAGTAPPPPPLGLVGAAALTAAIAQPSVHLCGGEQVAIVLDHHFTLNGRRSAGACLLLVCCGCVVHCGGRPAGRAASPGMRARQCADLPQGSPAAARQQCKPALPHCRSSPSISCGWASSFKRFASAVNPVPAFSGVLTACTTHTVHADAPGVAMAATGLCSGAQRLLPALAALLDLAARPAAWVGWDHWLGCAAFLSLQLAGAEVGGKARPGRQKRTSDPLCNYQQSNRTHARVPAASTRTLLELLVLVASPPRG